MQIEITLPASKEELSKLKAGDTVLLTGDILSARDAAHKRMTDILKAGGNLPFPVDNQIVYYMGPTPARPGEVIGSAGPTTSHRMDAYTPALLDLGLAGMIGKGARTQPVLDSIKKNGAVYFAATGGAGALLHDRITQSRVIAWEDLGTEAVRLLRVERFPAVVAVDAAGNDLFKTAPQAYKGKWSRGNKQ